MKKYTLFLVLAVFSTIMILPLDALSQSEESFTLARVKYRGGGDWYNDPSSLTNLIEFTRNRVPISISPEYDDVAIGSRDLFQYPFAFLTGHGTISLNRTEASNLRDYLDNGGFLYIDDDYGLDEHFRDVISQIYPEEELIEVPFEHDIYHQVYDFPDGLPKVHEHDGKAPQGFGLFREGRMVLFYTYESNLADGWANPEVHQNPESIRQEALQMGVNILVYALTSGK
ncbi:MAG: DUF4159 domain-containing protein [Balneolaceae bacterium]|nr:DUF4159 domain-containing protein [Balneolaceae bacterium]